MSARTNASSSRRASPRSSSIRIDPLRRDGPYRRVLCQLARRFIDRLPMAAKWIYRPVEASRLIDLRCPVISPRGRPERWPPDLLFSGLH